MKPKQKFGLILLMAGLLLELFLPVFLILDTAMIILGIALLIFSAER